MSDPEDDPPFGAQVYEELKRLGGFSILTGLMNYEQIQRLKAASREETVELFRGSEYLVLQRIRRDSPRELAAFLNQRLLAARAAGAVMGLMIGGLMFG